MGITLTVAGTALVLAGAHFHSTTLVVMGGVMIAVATAIEMKDVGYF